MTTTWIWRSAYRTRASPCRARATLVLMATAVRRLLRAPSSHVWLTATLPLDRACRQPLAAADSADDGVDLGLGPALLGRTRSASASPQTRGDEDEDDLMEAALAGGVRMSRPLSVAPTDPEQSLEIALAIERSDSSQALAKQEQQARGEELAKKSRHRRSESMEERKARIEADDWSLDFGARERFFPHPEILLPSSRA
jgi:hypothetical protein